MRRPMSLGECLASNCQIPEEDCLGKSDRYSCSTNVPPTVLLLSLTFHLVNKPQDRATSGDTDRICTGLDYAKCRTQSPFDAWREVASVQIPWQDDWCCDTATEGEWRWAQTPWWWTRGLRWSCTSPTLCLYTHNISSYTQYKPVGD